jgi:predicted HD phosphohydrolase
VTPEEQAAQSETWTAAVVAALLHDLGKIAVDLYVELDDGSL